MASPVHAALCALLAAAFYSALGHSVTRHVLPRTLAGGAAPVVGWAVFSAATLPVLTIIGFSAATVIAVGMLSLIASACLVVMRRERNDLATPAVPPWAYLAAAFLALGPTTALLPKKTAAGV